MVNWNDEAERAQRRYDALIRKAHNETKEAVKATLRPIVAQKKVEREREDR